MKGGDIANILGVISCLSGCIQAILYTFLIKNITKMSQASPNMLSDLPTPSAVFSVEGNIGCGKSSFLAALRNRLPEVEWIEQPVEQWKAVGEGKTNLLQRYYSEPQRWGFTFQVFAAFTRLRGIQEATLRFPHKVKISERSILADKHVFSELMRDLGFMAQSQFQIFKSLYTSMEAMSPSSKPRLIYLRCDPQTCFERIAHRKRPQQADISLDYLQKLHDKHEKWMQGSDPSQVLVLDAGQDFCNSEELLGRMVEQLVSFVRAEGTA